MEVHANTQTLTIHRHNPNPPLKPNANLTLKQDLTVIKTKGGGSLGGAAVWRLPLARGTILEAWDRIPRRAPCMEPASPSACVSASLSLSV